MSQTDSPNAAHTTRLQSCLDEADDYHFTRHPGARQRLRFYFPGERIEGGRPSRFIVVTRDAEGCLTRRFLHEEAA